jgi:hypothetical protein
MIDQIANGHRRDLVDRALGKLLCRLLLRSSVSVQIVISMSVIEQANGLPTPFDPQLEHDGIVLQWATLKLDKQTSVGCKRANEGLSH